MLARGDAVADKKRRSRWQEETLSLARGDALLSRGEVVAGKRRCSCWQEETLLLARGDVVTGRRRHSHRPEEMQLEET